jgi:hypothetical protein
LGVSTVEPRNFEKCHFGSATKAWRAAPLRRSRPGPRGRLASPSRNRRGARHRRRRASRSPTRSAPARPQRECAEALSGGRHGRPAGRLPALESWWWWDRSPTPGGDGRPMHSVKSPRRVSACWSFTYHSGQGDLAAQRAATLAAALAAPPTAYDRRLRWNHGTGASGGKRGRSRLRGTRRS